MSVLFLCIFGMAEFAYRKLNVKVEYTRKFVHIASGLMCLSFPYFIQNKWLVLVLAVNFFLLLLLSVKFKFLKGINNVERKTYGSFLFPLTIFVMYIIYQKLNNIDFYYLPLLIFAISDPLGALIGKSFPIKKYTLFQQQKSYGGSLAFLISALLIGVVYYKFESQFIINVITISILATITEAFSFKGTDNITVPLVVAITMYLFL